MAYVSFAPLVMRSSYTSRVPAMGVVVTGNCLDRAAHVQHCAWFDAVEKSTPEGLERSVNPVSCGLGGVHAGLMVPAFAVQSDAGCSGRSETLSPARLSEPPSAAPPVDVWLVQWAVASGRSVAARRKVVAERERTMGMVILTGRC